VFHKYGEVSKVLILGKAYKYGKRFGLIWFHGVQDARSLGLMLDKIFIGRYKLMVNTPKFLGGNDIESIDRM